MEVKELRPRVRALRRRIKACRQPGANVRELKRRVRIILLQQRSASPLMIARQLGVGVWFVKDCQRNQSRFQQRALEHLLRFRGQIE